MGLEASEPIYYTARQISTFAYEMTKWSEVRDDPLEVYRLAEGSWAKCTCPSFKNPCKHQKMLDALRASGVSPENWVKLSVTEDCCVHQLEGL